MARSEPWGQCRPRGVAAIAFYALKHRFVRGSFKRPVYRFIQRRCEAQDVELEGVRLRCHIADNGPERFVIFQEHRSSWEALRLSTETLQPGDIFVDIGANFGLFSTVAASKVGAAGRVLSIEPHPEMAKRLRFNVGLNGFDQVTVVEAAVGDQEGTAVLYVNKASFAESSLLATANIEGRIHGEIPVSVHPLLKIVEEAKLSRIDSVKIDVEGYEDKALVPFFRSAPRALWPRRALIETLHAGTWETDCVADMLARGYQVAHKTKSDTLLVLEG